jgi:hypothetical protein
LSERLLGFQQPFSRGSIPHLEETELLLGKFVTWRRLAEESWWRPKAIEAAVNCFRICSSPLKEVEPYPLRFGEGRAHTYKQRYPEGGRIAI